jgi:uncharacterized membrane protein AbrB (regulator of aidB expression)
MNNDPFEQMSHHESQFDNFIKPAGAALIGGFIGHMLSKTKFGQWFENSPVIGFIYFVILLAIIGFAAYCGFVFLYFLL